MTGYTQATAGDQTNTGAVAKHIHKPSVASGSLALAGGLVRRAKKIVAGAITFAGSGIARFMPIIHALIKLFRYPAPNIEVVETPSVHLEVNVDAKTRINLETEQD